MTNVRKPTGSSEVVVVPEANVASGNAVVPVAGGSSQNIAPIVSEDLPSSSQPAGAKPVGIAGLTVAQGLSQTQKPANLALIDGRYPDAVSFTTILKGLAGNHPAVQKLMTQITATTGMEIPPAMKNAVLAKPERLVDVLMATPKQISLGIDAMNAAYAAGQIKPLEPKTRLLPKTFDLANLGSLNVARPEYEMKELAPGLYQGDLKSDISDDAAKRNIVFAEVLDRLGDNTYAAADDRFKIKYGTHTFTRLDNFLEALLKDGHTLEARVEHRVANFANLKTKAPNGQFLDVPAAVLVRTGVADSKGQEALVPTVHTELVFSIRKSGDTKGPGIDADFKWYQGISGTGFWPCDLSKTPSWCGKTVSQSFTGSSAVEAAHLSGLLSDVINTSAAAQKLAVGGYGATGVCNDSVAIVQHALSGKATAYPLLMRDALLSAELTKRVNDENQLDDPSYQKLIASIKAVPSDDVVNSSSRERALISLPWVSGKEPFQSSADARKILSA